MSAAESRTAEPQCRVVYEPCLRPSELLKRQRLPAVSGTQSGCSLVPPDRPAAGSALEPEESRPGASLPPAYSGRPRANPVQELPTVSAASAASQLLQQRLRRPAKARARTCSCDCAPCRRLCHRRLSCRLPRRRHSGDQRCRKLLRDKDGLGATRAAGGGCHHAASKWLLLLPLLLLAVLIVSLLLTAGDCWNQKLLELLSTQVTQAVKVAREAQVAVWSQVAQASQAAQVRCLLLLHAAAGRLVGLVQVFHALF